MSADERKPSPKKKKADKNKTTLIVGERPPLGEDGAASSAALVLIHPPGPSIGRRFELDVVGASIGSLPQSGVVIEQAGVSRRHAKIAAGSDGWFVEDLESTNGTFVNDQRVQRRVLSDGDFLRIGTAILKFVSGEVEAAYHEAIYQMSVRDALTGLANRRMFAEFLEREVARSLRYRVPVSLVVLDVDHFKKINDERGHLAGDAVLRELGRRLKPRIRKEDLLARYGGEEFACVLTGTALPGALVFAQSVRMIVGGVPFQLDDASVRVTVSIGAATIDGTTPTTAEDLIGRADEKMYEAKHGGRNRVAG